MKSLFEIYDPVCVFGLQVVWGCDAD